MINPRLYMLFTLSPIPPKLLGIRNLLIAKGLRGSGINIHGWECRKIRCTSRSGIDADIIRALAISQVCTPASHIRLAIPDPDALKGVCGGRVVIVIDHG
jgi:hypothetical protein